MADAHAVPVTRRLDARDTRDTAAPRPNQSTMTPCLLPLCVKVRPTCPAFFAARITSATKLVGRLAPRSPPRCGLGSHGSRRLKCSWSEARGGSQWMAVGALNSLKKMPRLPSAPSERMAENLNPTNHVRAPDGAAFPLPSVGRFRCRLPPLRQPDPAPAMTRNRSLSIMAAMPTLTGRQKAFRLRRQLRPIDRCASTR